MKLIRLINADGAREEITDFPSSLLSSRTGLVNFFKLWAGRVFGGREGRDWRICVNDRCLAPVCVNQLVMMPDGRMEYGEQLVIE